MELLGVKLYTSNARLRRSLLCHISSTCVLISLTLYLLSTVMKQTCDNFNSSSCVPDTDCGCVSFHTYAVNRKLTRALGAIVGFSSVHFILMCIWTTLFSLWKDEVTAETSSSYTAIEN
eukprot:m.1003269 g.1003269  ORF g.1003269 m.1003269 type:complete len:119 (-) comp24043_c0_seq2:4135-4491(-)